MSQDSTYPGIRRALRLSYSDAEVSFVFAISTICARIRIFRIRKGRLCGGGAYVGKVGTLT